MDFSCNVFNYTDWSFYVWMRMCAYEWKILNVVYCFKLARFLRNRKYTRTKTIDEIEIGFDFRRLRQYVNLDKDVIFWTYII